MLRRRACPQDDPRRVEFGRLHGLSASVQMVPILGGLLLLFFEMQGLMAHVQDYDRHAGARVGGD